MRDDPDPPIPDDPGDPPESASLFGATPPAPPRALERIGGYPVLRVLGQGGMGVVYEAVDPRLERPVAIKMLSPEFARDRDRVLWLQREARLLASLNHPGIATIYGLEQTDDGALFLVMELVRGETLFDRLRRAPLGIRDALRIGVELTEALAEAHERGVIHRDLKPGNIMLTTTGRVKVLDFGLAESHAGLPHPDDPEAALRTAEGSQTGRLSGTRGYMSPEQARGLPQDKRTDLFAFGCVLYECLAGRRAFPGSRGADPLVLLAQDPAWDALPAELPDPARELLRRCLDKNTETRLAEITEARLALEAALGSRASRAVQDRAALARVPNNLPVEPTSFVGRADDLAACHDALHDARLVTLTGVGGCGKSRLALRAARDLAVSFPDGVWFVALAPVSDAAGVVRAVAAVLGVKDEPGRTLEDGIVTAVAARSLLLVLDNCEHVLAPVASLVTRLLREAPRAHVLATSRERVGIPAEHVHAVSALRTPPADAPADTATRYESVLLFTERAAFADPEFRLSRTNAASVMAVCRKLEGIPLALELAAARVRLLSVEQILARLDDRLRLLTGGHGSEVAHHETLRATLDWSYDLLEPTEQRLLCRLAVFRGGWTWDAAAQVASPDDDEFEVLESLARLVDKSLVVVEKSHGDTSRYRLLETVRQHAEEKLVSKGAMAALRVAHAAYFAAAAQRAEPELEGRDAAALLKTLETESDNLAAALRAAEQLPEAAEHGLCIAGALWRFWYYHGHIGSGRAALEAALRYGAHLDPALRAKALNGAGALALVHADYDAARARYEACLDLRRALQDTQGVAKTLNNLGSLAWYQGDLDRASELYEESLAVKRGLGNLPDLAVSLNNLGSIRLNQGRHADAAPLFTECLAIHRQLGNRTGEALTLHNMGIAARRAGTLDRARELHTQSLVLEEALGNTLSSIPPLFNLALVEVLTGHPDAAITPLGRAVALVRETGDTRFGAYTLEVLAHLADARGDGAAASRFLGLADALREQIGSPRSPAEVEELQGLLALHAPLRAVAPTLDAALQAAEDWLGRA